MLLTLKIGVDSDQYVELDLTPAEAVLLGQKYLEYEASLPVGARLCGPTMAMVQAALDPVVAGLAQAQTQEQDRTELSIGYHAAVKEAIPPLKDIIEELMFEHRANLGLLGRWGLETTMGTGGKVRVDKPGHESEWANFLLTYTTQEVSVHPTDWQPTPRVARLLELAGIVRANRAGRDAAYSARTEGTEIRDAHVGALLDLLQLACGMLVATQFGGYITTSLERWGFTVKAVQPAAAPAVQPAAAPAAQPAA